MLQTASPTPLLFGAFWVGGEQFQSSAMKFSETFADAEASEASEGHSTFSVLLTQ